MADASDVGWLVGASASGSEAAWHDWCAVTRLSCWP